MMIQAIFRTVQVSKSMSTGNRWLIGEIDNKTGFTWVIKGGILVMHE